MSHKNFEKIKEDQKKYYLINKEIIKKRHKEYYLKNKDAIKKQQKEYLLKNKEKRKNYLKKKYFESPISIALNNAKQRAKLKNLPFEIDYKYLKDIYPKNNICPVLNIPFQLGYLSEIKKNSDYAPSLDRIIPEKGYVKGNLIFVCNIVNRIKSDSSLDMLEKTLKFYKNLNAS